MKYLAVVLILAGGGRATPPPWRELRGPIRAVSWSKLPDGLVNTSPMIWVRKDTDPADAAALSRTRPEGRAAIFLWDMARDLLNHPEDRCRTPEGGLTAYPSPWPEHGIAELKQRAEEFFTAYRAAGGRLDFLVLDYEGGLSMWHMGQRRAEHCRAIQNDPRSSGLKRELGFEDFSHVIEWRGHTDYLKWNAVLGRYVDVALNRALFNPVRELYPKVKASNYGSYTLTPDNVVPDLNGHQQYRYGGCGTHASCSFYGNIGQLAQRSLAGDQPYGNQPFDVLRWQLNKMRGLRRSSAWPIEPWVSHKNFQSSRFRDNDYYQELILHLALTGAEDFLFWNPDRWREGQDPSHYRTDEHDRLFDGLLTILNDKLGDATRESVTLDPIPWDSALIVTGMRVGDEKVVWRVTVPPGVSKVKVDPAGREIDLAGALGAWFEARPGEAVTFEPLAGE